MEDTMHADFHEVFYYDRRPKQAVAFVVQPGRRNLPRDVVEVAIAAGKATAVVVPGKPRKTTTKNHTTTAA